MEDSTTASMPQGSLSWTIIVAFDGVYNKKRPQHLVDDLLIRRVNVDWKILQDDEFLYVGPCGLNNLRRGELIFH